MFSIIMKPVKLLWILLSSAVIYTGYAQTTDTETGNESTYPDKFEKHRGKYPNPIRLVVDNFNGVIKDPRFYVRPEETKELLSYLDLSDCNTPYQKALKLWNYVMDHTKYVPDKDRMDEFDKEENFLKESKRYRLNVWETPKEIIKKEDNQLIFQADSEDLACLLCSMMIEAGIPRENVYVATNHFISYSWVYFYHDKTIYCLDPSLVFEEKPNKLFTTNQIMQEIAEKNISVRVNMYPISKEIDFYSAIILNNDIDAFLDIDKENEIYNRLWDIPDAPPKPPEPKDPNTPSKT